jgi:hypothetical protein
MYSATIDYLGKKFDVDYEITQDHNGDDEVQVESIMFCAEEMSEFFSCVYSIDDRTVLDEIGEMIYKQHKEPEEEYDSTQVEDE